jgi:hypothetical protein
MRARRKVTKALEAKIVCKQGFCFCDTHKKKFSPSQESFFVTKTENQKNM